MKQKMHLPSGLWGVAICLLLNATNTFAQNPAFQVTSTTGGFVAPSMTSAQRSGITSPVAGSLVYQTDATAGYYYYNGSAWVQLTSSTGTVTSVAALTLGTTGTDLSSSVATGTTTPVITLNVPTASATNRGALSSADWTTFNSKLGTSLTSANIWVGNASNVATAVSMSGDATISNTGALTVADNSVDGTDIALGSDAQGDIMYYNGTDWVRLAAGTSGQFLKTQGAAANPVWASDNNSGGTVGGSGTANQAAYWSAANTLTSDASVTINPNTTTTTLGSLAVTSSSTTANTQAIYGSATGAAQVYGVLGTTSSATWNAAGVKGSATAGAFGVWGTASSNGAYGVYGENTSTGTGSQYGVVGVKNGSTGTGTGYGVWGQATGTGTTNYGGYFSSSGATNNYGVIGFNSSTGTGVIGVSNNLALTALASGSGGSFKGTTYGMAAYSTSATTSIQRAAIYSEQNGTTCLINAWSSGNTQYKIWGSGTVSTLVKDLSGNSVTLHCPETPEIYFQDFGTGQLINGNAHIEIDKIFSKNIIVDDKHQMHVFIQLYDNENCKGVVIKNRTKNGFDVLELDGGTSNTSFSWTITCNRADEYDENGKLYSRYQDLRFEQGPEIESKTSVPTRDQPESLKYIAPPKK